MPPITVDPALAIALAAIVVSLFSLAHALFKPSTPASSNPAVHPTLAPSPSSVVAGYAPLNPSAIANDIATARTVLLSYLATNPLAVSAAADLVTALEARIEASTTSDALKQIEMLAFSAVNTRLKAMAGLSPAIPPAS